MGTDRQLVRMLVRSREDFQAMRKRNDNRLGRKADGTEQTNLTERVFSEEDAGILGGVSDAARQQEKDLEKQLREALKRFPVYTEFLNGVKGVGEIAAGWIVGEYDIHIADTPSKLWQFTGLNPDLVRGKKRVAVDKYTPGMGKVVSEYRDKDGKAEEYVVLTDELVRGDKLTPGFVAPFNKRLRTAMVGVLADGFIKAQSSYALEYYYPYKERLANSENEVEEISTAGAKPKDVAWKEAKKAHRDRAAKRYMIKMFLVDLYKAWRPLEGLPVRPSYHEEKLGHKHK